MKRILDLRFLRSFSDRHRSESPCAATNRCKRVAVMIHYLTFAPKLRVRVVIGHRQAMCMYLTASSVSCNVETRATETRVAKRLCSDIPAVGDCAKNLDCISQLLHFA